MSVPNYILIAARNYAKEHGGGRKTEDAFIAGFEASRSWKKKDEAPLPIDTQLFEECWKMYGLKGSRSASLSEWCKLTDNERGMVMPHIKAYTTTRDKIYQKDFERYLKNKTFMDAVIVKGGVVVYNPTQIVEDEGYHPLTDMFQTWNDARHCLMFNGDIDNLNDGYTSDNRPDGAMVAWGMYSWKWNKVRREWIKQ